MSEKSKVPDKTLEPIGELVLLVVAERDKSKAGIVLPDVTRERLAKGEQGIDEEAVTGTVVAAGAQCRYVRRGDTVVIGQVRSFKYRGQQVHFCKESELLFVASDGNGKVPSHKVTDWREHVVERDDAGYDKFEQAAAAPSVPKGFKKPSDKW